MLVEQQHWRENCCLEWIMIPRRLKSDLENRIRKGGKVIIVYGARQVGKTTLIRDILKDISDSSLEISADLFAYQEAFSSRELKAMQSVVAGYDVLFLDEAQRIPDIGINLKILHEGIPDLKIIVSGSSSLDLAQQLHEPLTGRTWTYILHPVSVQELKAIHHWNAFELKQQLPSWLRWGMYPETLQLDNQDDKRQYLNELTTAYLYKDILEIGNIRYPDKIRQLLKLLAYQVGQEVSIHELANTLQISRDTVTNYIDLLEKSFVIFRVGAFSRNLRKEVTSKDKIYFYDCGVRNAIIENFASVELRPDIGALWENFLMVERRKKMHYEHLFASMYYWRTYTGAELDYVEEADGVLETFEFKWQNRTGRLPSGWTSVYGETPFSIIHPDNFESFVG